MHPRYLLECVGSELNVCAYLFQVRTRKHSNSQIDLMANMLTTLLRSAANASGRQLIKINKITELTNFYGTQFRRTESTDLFRATHWT